MLFIVCGFFAQTKPLTWEQKADQILAEKDQKKIVNLVKSMGDDLENNLELFRDTYLLYADSYFNSLYYENCMKLVKQMVFYEEKIIIIFNRYIYVLDEAKKVVDEGNLKLRLDMLRSELKARKDNLTIGLAITQSEIKADTVCTKPVQTKKERINLIANS